MGGEVGGSRKQLGAGSECTAHHAHEVGVTSEAGLALRISNHEFKKNQEYGISKRAHLAHEVGAAGEAGVALLGRLRLLLTHRQEGARHAVHKLRRLPRQWLHRVAQLDDLRRSVAICLKTS